MSFTAISGGVGRRASVEALSLSLLSIDSLEKAEVKFMWPNFLREQKALAFERRSIRGGALRTCTQLPVMKDDMACWTRLLKTHRERGRACGAISKRRSGTFSSSGPGLQVSREAAGRVSAAWPVPSGGYSGACCIAHRSDRMCLMIFARSASMSPSGLTDASARSAATRAG